ncbi:MFS transporter [Gordonia sp. VNK21]|uniref:MFS transporter n=1 Tax=Gordonia sp. VNK21 TaxID=3382483 RepID=UPI0038D39537
MLTALVFFVATAEFAVIGLDDQIAADLGFADTSIGYVVSAYAVGMIVGGPLLVVTPAARRANPTMLLTALTVAYAMLTILASVAPSLALLVVARAVAGAFGSAVIGSCMAYGARVATESERGAAQAWVLSGLSFGTTFGLPIAAFLSTVYSWRTILLLVGAGVLIVGLAAAKIVPVHFVPDERAQDRVSPRPRFAATALRFATSSFVTAAVFSVFSSAAVLLRSVGFADQRQAVVLFGYGLATIVGTVMVGALIAKAGEERVTAIGTALLTLLLLGAAILSALTAVELVIFFVLLGVTGVSMNPAFAVRVMKTGGVGVVVNTLHSSVINCGIVVGGVIAGAVTRSDGRNSALFVIAAALAGAALLTVLAAGKRPTDQRSPDNVRT